MCSSVVLVGSSDNGMGMGSGGLSLDGSEVVHSSSPGGHGGSVVGSVDSISSLSGGNESADDSLVCTDGSEVSVGSAVVGSGGMCVSSGHVGVASGHSSVVSDGSHESVLAGGNGSEVVHVLSGSSGVQRGGTSVSVVASVVDASEVVISAGSGSEVSGSLQPNGSVVQEALSVLVVFPGEFAESDVDTVVSVHAGDEVLGSTDVCVHGADVSVHSSDVGMCCASVSSCGSGVSHDGFDVSVDVVGNVLHSVELVDCSLGVGTGTAEGMVSCSHVSSVVCSSESLGAGHDAVVSHSHLGSAGASVSAEVAIGLCAVKAFSAVSVGVAVSLTILKIVLVVPSPEIKMGGKSNKNYTGNCDSLEHLKVFCFEIPRTLR